MSDVLAAVAENELHPVFAQGAVKVFSTNDLTAYDNAQIAFKNNYWQVVYNSLPSNWCPSSVPQGQFEMSPEQITGCYLLQVQSWYGKAGGTSSGVANPSTLDISRLIRSDSYISNALEVLQNNSYWGCDGIHPCNWGNYGFDSSPESAYQLVLANNEYVYCHNFRDFTEGGDPNVVLHDPATAGSDAWDDTIFVLVSSSSRRKTSIYEYKGNPDWLFASNIQPGFTYYRQELEARNGDILLNCFP